MNKTLLFLTLFFSVSLNGQTRSLTLDEAVKLALEQNPDLLLARIDAERTAGSIAVAQGAFATQAFAGSGLGWTDGIPQSVEGATPAAVQASARRTIFDRSAQARVKEAQANAEAARYSAAAKEDEVAYRIAAAWLDLDQSDRLIELLGERIPRFRAIEETMALRVKEGRALPLEASRTKLERVRAERLLDLERSRRRGLEATLASYLGLDPAVSISTLGEGELEAGRESTSPAESAARAAEQSPELDSLASNIAAKEMAVKAEKGASMPRLDFVAQYSLLTRFNNYEEFFNRFQRHNAQAGIALRVPLFRSRDVSARVAKAQIDRQKAELELDARRSGIELESIQLFQAVEQAEGARQIARMELDFAREKVEVALAQLEEGRAALDAVEQARLEESLAWQRLYESRYAEQRARLNLLRRTGDLAMLFR